MTSPGLHMQAFSSARLVYDLVHQADAPELQAMTDDRSITDAISFLCSPFTEADCRALIARFSTPRDAVFTGRRKTDNMMVCVIGAHLAQGGRIEVGYWVGKEQQGQGYGFEAARALLGQLRRLRPGIEIFAECAPTNRVSRRLLEKLGFETTDRPGARPGRVEFVYGATDRG